MVKNIILCSISFILLLNNFSVTDLNQHNIAEDYSDIEFESGEYFNKMWRKDDDVGVAKTDCVPDMESAIKIANVVFENEQKKGCFKNCELQHVFYDESDCVWVVSYWQSFDDVNLLIDGGDFSVAISQKSGEILKRWAGE